MPNKILANIIAIYHKLPKIENIKLKTVAKSQSNPPISRKIFKPLAYFNFFSKTNL